GVGPQGGIGEGGAAAADRAGPLEQLAQARCEDAVAVIDGVLRLANEMGEADLIVLGGPAHLRGEAIGDPEVRANRPEEVRRHLLAPARPDDKAAVVGMME